MSHLDIKDYSSTNTSESSTKLSDRMTSKKNKEDGLNIESYNTEEKSSNHKNEVQINEHTERNDSEASSGLLAMPSKRLNLTYRAVLLSGGEEEKRRAVVDILKKCQIQDEEEDGGSLRGKIRCNVMK